MTKSALTLPRMWSGRDFLFCLLCVGLVLAVLFRDGFHPDKVIFSNDGPLGLNSALPYAQNLTGTWFDLNWLGISLGPTSPSLSILLIILIGPLYYAKFLAPISMLVLGVCAWLFLRQSGLNRTACVLGALAAALNSNIFSHVCWGLGSRALTVAMFFLAMTFMVTPASRFYWLKPILAGAAIGMGIMEGADNGVIFSLYMAAFVLFQAWLDGKSVAEKARKGILRVAMVAVFAGILAAHGISSLWGFAVKNVAGMNQDAATKAQTWNFATQWSLSKTEMLRVIIPGLFGYRMDTPNGGNYWGSVGQDIEVPKLFQALQDPNREVREQAAGLLQRVTVRHSGAGEYAGVLVVLIGLWAIVQSFRKSNSPFSPVERRWIWFWGIAALISMLLACGRYAPFYQILYAIPYFSTIRNPMKFMHPFHAAFIILFAYGVHGLAQRYLETVVTRTKAAGVQAKGWWASMPAFDKRWVVGLIVGSLVCAVGWLFYANSRGSLEKHLQFIGFDSSMAGEMARFSISEAGWFVFFLFLSAALVTWICTGAFAGRRATWAAVLLGLLLVVDMGRANKPWIVSYDYKQKYASNPVVDILREKPYEARVSTVPPLPVAGESQLDRYFPQLYGIEWTQHLFPYYGVQSLDVVQMSRRPVDYDRFEPETFALNSPARLPLQPRHWQLTNTRYLLGRAAHLEALNQLAPGQFQIRTRFDLVPKSGVGQVSKLEDLTAAAKADGPLALFEFKGALPRAKLFSNWQTATNDQAALQQLADPNFNPAQTVLVANSLPAPAAAGSTNQPGEVEISHYSAKRTDLKARAETPSVLLLNDRFDQGWKAFVDGKEVPLLRCNFLMRGVQLQPGNHTVTFKFQPPVVTLYITAAAMAVSLLLCGLLFVSRPGPAPVAPAPMPAPKPQKASR